MAENPEGKTLDATLYWAEREIEFFFAYSYDNTFYRIRDLSALEPGWFVFEIFRPGVGVTRTFFKYEDFGANDIVEFFGRFVKEPEKVLETLLGERIPIKEILAMDWPSVEDEEATYIDPYYGGEADYGCDDVFDDE